MATHFFPIDTHQTTILLGTFVLVAVVSFWSLSRVGFPFWPKSVDYLVWERDRVLAVAKGTATSAVGFLTAVVIALLKDEIKADVPGVEVLGCVLGAVGLLLFATRMSMSVRASIVDGI